jgi:hypothetical protein
MDCREALQILEFSDVGPDASPGADVAGSEAVSRAEPGSSEAGAATASSSPAEADSIWSADDKAAAQAHLAGCPACERAMRQRRELDRSIGRVMRNVPVPRGAQHRLLAQLAELEAADAATGASVEGTSAHAETTGSERDASVVPGAASPLRPTRRRFLKTLVPLSALVLALAGFFGVVWLFSPHFSVNDVSGALADIDFKSLGQLGDFTGSSVASGLPSEPGWDHLKWQCDKHPKSLPLASANVIAVYGFELPKSRQPGVVQGLIAVIPRSRVHNPPTADSLATASPSDYLTTARIGESVCVAWQQDDFVYVCLVSGPDSLSRLQSVLQQPAA